MLRKLDACLILQEWLFPSLYIYSLSHSMGGARTCLEAPFSHVFTIPPSCEVGFKTESRILSSCYETSLRGGETDCALVTAEEALGSGARASVKQALSRLKNGKGQSNLVLCRRRSEIWWKILALRKCKAMALQVDLLHVLICLDRSNRPEFWSLFPRRTELGNRTSFRSLPMYRGYLGSDPGRPGVKMYVGSATEPSVVFRPGLSGFEKISLGTRAGQRLVTTAKGEGRNLIAGCFGESETLRKMRQPLKLSFWRVESFSGQWNHYIFPATYWETLGKTRWWFISYHLYRYHHPEVLLGLRQLCEIHSPKLGVRTWKLMLGRRSFPFADRPVFRAVCC